MNTEHSHKITPTLCLNCSTAVQGEYCHQCGQSVRENTDRSIGKLLADFLDNVFFFDNRFIISLWYLFRFPGRMTVEFLEGKRKKFVSPVTLFLLFNLIYFLINPLTDYSISLIDQIYGQPYSEWVKPWVDAKMQNDGLNELAYGSIYQNASDTISKSIMIINVPLIAVFVHLMVLKKRGFYYDSLIFALHFFSFFMGSWIIMDWADSLIYSIAGHEDSKVAAISFSFFTTILPLLYAALSMKKFITMLWYWAIGAGIGVIIAVSLVNFLYRLIILVLTVWMT